MIKRIVQSVLISTFAMAAAPAYLAEAWQAFDCELVEGKTDVDVMAAAKRWLQAARTMKGGEDLQVSIHFPVAAASWDTDFKILVKAPSFAAWGITSLTLPSCGISRRRVCNKCARAGRGGRTWRRWRRGTIEVSSSLPAILAVGSCCQVWRCWIAN